MNQTPPAETPSTHRSRLGLGHLMLWTLCCGVVVSVAVRLENWEAMTPAVRFGLRLYFMTLGIVYGAALAAIAVFAYRVWKRRPVAPQPGHRLLLLGGAVMLIDVAVYLSIRYLSGHADRPLTFDAPGPYCRYQAGTHGLWALVLGLTLLLGLGAAGWRLFLLGPLVLCLAMWWWHRVFLVGQADAYARNFSWWWGAPVSVYITLSAVCIVALLTVATVDSVRYKDRDWMHWTGVGFWLALASLQIVTRSVLQV